MEKIRKIGMRFVLLTLLASVSFMGQASVDMPGTLDGPLSVIVNSDHPLLQLQSDEGIQLAAKMVVRRSNNFRGRRGAKRLSKGGNTNSQVKTGSDRSHVNFTRHRASKSSTSLTTTPKITTKSLPPTLNPYQSKNGGVKKKKYKNKVKKKGRRYHAKTGKRRHRSHRSHRSHHGRRHR